MRPRTLLVAALLSLLLSPLLPVEWSSPVAGQAPDGEIIGGGPAAPGEYPFQVALLLHSRPNRYRARFCGGSLIAPDVVLTAAHCLELFRASEIDVLAGTHTLAAGGGGMRVRAKSLRIHPGYNPRTLGNDLGIIRLRRPVPYETVRPVARNEGALWRPGIRATVTGWGNTRALGARFPVLLQEVRVPVRSDAYCGHRSHYGPLFVADKMFCAGESNGGEDACQGDSGGPIVVPDGGEWVQIGIVSWGIGCARARFPGVYTELARYRPFLNPHLT